MHARHRMLALSLIVTAFDVTTASAGWVEGGVPVNSAAGSAVTGSLAADGIGGLFAQTLISPVPRPPDIAQSQLVSHFDGGGDQLGLVPLGLTSEYLWSDLVADGSGGFYFATARWLDPGYDIRVRRLDSTGVPVAGWPAAGVIVPKSLSEQPFALSLRASATGGVLLEWIGFDQFGQQLGHLIRVSPLGITTERYGTCLCTEFARYVEDPAGRLFIQLNSSTSTATELRCLSSSDVQLWRRSFPPGVGQGVFPDGNGGATVYFTDFLSTPINRRLRLGSTGLPAPGYPSNGKAEPDFGSTPTRVLQVQLLDPAGNRLMLFQQPEGVYGIRWLANDELDPTWPSQGRLLLLAEATPSTGYFTTVPDGSGGAFIGWVDSGVHMAHVLADGSRPPNEPVAGQLVSRPNSTALLSILPVSGTDAIALFLVNDTPLPGASTVLLQRFPLALVVPVQSSLVTREVSPTRVRLVWELDLGAGETVIAERRARQGVWELLATLTLDGTHRVDLEDLTVSPGASYEYRLRRDTETFGQIDVDVPLGNALAVGAPSPHPMRVGASLSIELPGSESASIELLDLAGRRRWSEQLDAGSAGTRSIRLANGAALRPGVYVVRVVQGRSTASRPVVIVQ